MTFGLYLFVLPIVFILLLLAVRYFEKKFSFSLYQKMFFWKKFEVVDGGNMDNNSSQGEEHELDNFALAKDKIFDYLDFSKERSIIIMNKFFHWLLHFFVIALKYLSILTDSLYAKSRDFFLYTATKEKEVVSTFWHTLKEYKKEKELDEDR